MPDPLTTSAKGQATSGEERPILLKICDLEKHFHHEGSLIRALNGMSMEIRRGDMISIVGQSGAGKSTFLQVVGTLDRPTGGQVFYEGQDVFAMSGKAVARFRNATIGFVFQFHYLLPEFTALENTMMPALIQRMPRPEAEAQARSLLEEVGLSERLSHKPGELSGGEQQRVALARALVLRPDLLLADEPTGNLDPTTGEGIHQLIFRLNQERGVTVVMVTHNQALAQRMPIRYVMEAGTSRRLLEGELAFEAPPAGGLA